MALQKQCTVKIWRAQPSQVGPAQWPLLAQLLDAGEQARAARFRFTADCRAYVLAHGLRRLALAELLGLPGRGAAAALRWGHDAAGRPFLVKDHGRPDAARWFFSHAHAREGVLFAATRAHPVGIDLEPLQPATADPALLRRYMAWPRDAGLDWDTAGGFAQGWTALESFVKSLGCGLPGLSPATPVRCSVSRSTLRASSPAASSVPALTLRLALPCTRGSRHRQEALVLRPQAPEGCTAALALRQAADAAPPRLEEYSFHTDAALLRRLC